MGEGGQGGEGPTAPPAEDPLSVIGPGAASPEPIPTPSAALETAEPLPPLDLEAAVDSDFAGVFFLLNAGIALGLYSDFTSPVQQGIDLSIWDFLALAGGVLTECGATPKEYDATTAECDATPRQLGVTPNRFGVTPGGLGVMPGELGATLRQLGVTPGELGVTPKQLSAMPNQLGATPRELGVMPNRFGVMPGELGVTPRQLGATPEQLGVTDFSSDPVWPLLAALANRPDGMPPGSGFTPPDGLPLAAWVAATAERIRERLALAGIDDPLQVVRRFGRVTLTPAHLDVSFSLAAHPIAIRMAGLDRDPGWIPAAGRHVAFHFD